MEGLRGTATWRDDLKQYETAVLPLTFLNTCLLFYLSSRGFIIYSKGHF